MWYLDKSVATEFLLQKITLMKRLSKFNPFADLLVRSAEGAFECALLRRAKNSCRWSQCALMTLLVVVMLAVGCRSSHSDTPTESIYDGELRLTSGITSRAYGTTWEKSDVVGVYMLESDQKVLVGEKNTPYTTSETTATAMFVAVGTPLYYPESGLVDVLAYYPYDVGVENGVYKINTTNQSNIGDIDLLLARRNGVGRSDGSLALDFDHVLSKIVVTLKADTDSNFTPEELASATVKLSGTICEATYELYSSTADNQLTLTGASTQSMTLNRDEVSVSNICFSGIVIPQVVSDLRFTISIPTYDDVSIVIAEQKSFVANRSIYTHFVFRMMLALSWMVQNR